MPALITAYRPALPAPASAPVPGVTFLTFSAPASVPAVLAPALTPVASLQAASLPLDGPHALVAGRPAFDGASLKAPSEPVSVAVVPARGSLLGAPSFAARAAVVVPAMPLLAQAEPSQWPFLALLGFLLAAMVLASRVLLRPRARTLPPFQPLPPAFIDLDSIRDQSASLADELLGATAGERTPAGIERALSARWQRALSEGGVRVFTPEGTVRAVPVAPEVFAAIDLPSILSSLAGKRNDPDRYFSAIGDLLRGLPLDASRAATAERALESLAWWKAHFRQFSR